MKKNIKNLNFRIFSIILSILLLVGDSVCLVFGEVKIDPNNNCEPVSVAMAFDKNYALPTLVSLTSIFENANDTTKYDIYLLCSNDIKPDHKKALLNLKEKYPKNCNSVSFIEMGDSYKDANSKGLVTAAYYRLSLSSLLPNVNKIIWLDGDTLTLKDLSDFYNINMDNLYYRGLLDHIAPKLYVLDDLGIEDDHYICTGVMLVNLEKLRKDNIEQKFKEFIEKNNEILKQHDQTVINAVCYLNIDILPPKIGMFNYFKSNSALRSYVKSLKAKNKYTFDEVLDAFNNPTVIHCVDKPWVNHEFYFGDVWWKYAQKTDLKDEIFETYKNAFEDKNKDKSKVTKTYNADLLDKLKLFYSKLAYYCHQ